MAVPFINADRAPPPELPPQADKTTRESGLAICMRLIFMVPPFGIEAPKFLFAWHFIIKLLYLVYHYDTSTIGSQAGFYYPILNALF